MAALDLSQFLSSSFKADTFLQTTLATQPESAVRDYLRALSQAKSAAAGDLQKNVHKNYAEFVAISKEISSLEGDFLALRSLLNELSAVNAVFRTADPTAVLERKDDVTPISPNLPDFALGSLGAENGAAADGSIDVGGGGTTTSKEVLQEFYESIDGLQKTIPLSRGHFVAFDGSKRKFFEVHPSTYRHRQAVQLHLLGDTVLVTVKKKNLMSGRSRMVLEKWMRVADMAAIDMKDSVDVTNAFKIMCHPDMFIFRSERAEDKRAFLSTLKRLTESSQLQKRRQRDEADEYSQTEALNCATSMPAAASPQDGDVEGPSISKEKAKEEISPSEKKWLSDLPFELDILIAHRQFDDAIGDLERSKPLLGKLQDSGQSLRAAVEARAQKLAHIVCSELVNPMSSKFQIQSNIERLLKLGLAVEAREIFLQSRTEIIRYKIRLLHFNGDIATYVNSLSIVVFRLIRNTCDWYSISFKEPSMASGFLRWVRTEIENYGDIVRRQVFESRQPFAVIADCLDSSMNHCAQLRQVGLDLTFVLEQLFHRDVVAAIEDYRARAKLNIVRFIKEDTFVFVKDVGLKEPASEDDHFDFGSATTTSVYQFYNLLMEFGADMGLLVSISLYAKIIWCLTDFFSTFVSTVLEVISGSSTNRQGFAMLSNCRFIVEKMMPRVAQHLAVRFERSIPELDEQGKRLAAAIDTTLEQALVSKIGAHILSRVYSLHVLDFSSSAAILDQANPTDNMIVLLGELDRMLSDAADFPSVRARRMVSDVILQLFSTMLLDTSWETERGERRFGFCGVQQLVLDVHFFLRVAGAFVNPVANAKANAVCERALKVYFGQNPGVKEKMKSGDWYEQRVKAAQAAYGRNWPFLQSTSKNFS
ncbi:hypothetical protein DFJ73DRAFT_839749 [Zopfochytrium polystomum]|nr:hypothetical protein DFJ73DRAFT_839749 [Zopfochytrium polystomum]